MDILSKTYKSDLASEEQLSLELKEQLQSAGMSEQICREFMLVVSEAFTNAVIHGNGLNSPHTISAKIYTNENILSADIIDQGKGGMDLIKNRIPADLNAEGGRGVDMIIRYATSVEFSETAEGGLKVSIQLMYKEEEMLIDS